MIAAALLSLVLSQGTVNLQFKTSDQSTSSASYVDVDEIGVGVGANETYAMQWFLTVSSASALTGIQLAVNGPASPTVFVATITCFSALGTPVTTNTSTYDSGLDLTTSAGTTKVNCTITTTFVNGANSGTLVPRLRSSSGGTAVTVYQGSRAVYVLKSEG